MVRRSTRARYRSAPPAAPNLFLAAPLSIHQEPVPASARAIFISIFISFQTGTRRPVVSPRRCTYSPWRAPPLSPRGPRSLARARARPPLALGGFALRLGGPLSAASRAASRTISTRTPRRLRPRGLHPPRSLRTSPLARPRRSTRSRRACARASAAERATRGASPGRCARTGSRPSRRSRLCPPSSSSPWTSPRGSRRRCASSSPRRPRRPRKPPRRPRRPRRTPRPAPATAPPPPPPPPIRPIRPIRPPRTGGSAAPSPARTIASPAPSRVAPPPRRRHPTASMAARADPRSRPCACPNANACPPTPSGPARPPRRSSSSSSACAATSRPGASAEAERPCGTPRRTTTSRSRAG